MDNHPRNSGGGNLINELIVEPSEQHKDGRRNKAALFSARARFEPWHTCLPVRRANQLRQPGGGFYFCKWNIEGKIIGRLRQSAEVNRDSRPIGFFSHSSARPRRACILYYRVQRVHVVAFGTTMLITLRKMLVMWN